MSKSKPTLDPALVRAVFERMQAQGKIPSPGNGIFAEAQGVESVPAPVAPTDQLADTIPPTEPPELATTTPPRPFDVVRWHINPPRVTVEHCADLASARAHVAALHFAVFWKWAIRDPQPWPHVVDTGTIEPPADAPAAAGPFGDVQFADNPPVSP